MAVLLMWAGGQVVGPVGSAGAALKLLQTCVVAAAHLQLRYPNAIVYRKPVSTERLLKTLAEMTGR